MDETATELGPCGCALDVIDIGFCDLYDAYWCMACNHWIEHQCGDFDCEFCANRPETHEFHGACPL